MSVEFSNPNKLVDITIKISQNCFVLLSWKQMYCFINKYLVKERILYII